MLSVIMLNVTYKAFMLIVCMLIVVVPARVFVPLMTFKASLLSAVKFVLNTFSTAALSMMTHSIMTELNDTTYTDTQHYGIQCNGASDNDT
jgi:hypothetical protein